MRQERVWRHADRSRLATGRAATHHNRWVVRVLCHGRRGRQVRSCRVRFESDVADVHDASHQQRHGCRLPECVLGVACGRAPVLLDIRLGADDGLDLARRLRSDPATRTLPILALSADAMQHDRERAAEAGCDAHLAKPVVARDLLGSISRLLEAAEAGPSAGGLPAEGRLGA